MEPRLTELTDEFYGILEGIRSSGYVEAEVATTLTRLGWALYSDSIYGADRTMVLNNASLMLRKDPMARNAIRIWQSFVLGSGMTWDAGTLSVNNPKVKMLKKFWGSAKNNRFTRFKGQRDAYEKLLAEGEIYYGIFTGVDGTTPIIRTFPDSTEFLDPVTDPEDRTVILLYPRKFTVKKWVFTDQGPEVDSSSPQNEQIKYYRAWDADPAKIKALQISPDKIVPKVTINRLCINEYKMRGYPLVESSIDWMKAFKGFMEDRVTMARASARYAWNLKGAVSEPVLRTAMSALETGESATTNRPGTSGVGRIFGSNSFDLTPMRGSSGGSEAREDARLIRQMVGAGVGITEPNLTGDPSVGNLASLTAMDGVMARNFVSDQFLLRDFWMDIFSAVLANGSEDMNVLSQTIEWVKGNLTVSYPSVVVDDVVGMVGALVQAAPYLPEEFLQSRILKVFGEKDPNVWLDNEGKESASTTPTNPPEV